jgi:hypothetical protein
MKRAIPWTLAILSFVAFAASFTELQRLRVRFGEVTRHHFQDHQEVREFIIKSALGGIESPIVVFGDSLVEMAELPKSACGKLVVNAGIGGSQTSDFLRLAPKLLNDLRPAAIIVGLGANDHLPTDEQGALMQTLRSFSPVVISTPTTHDQFAETDFMEDGIHLTKKASAAWIAKMVSRLERSLSNCD